MNFLVLALLAFGGPGAALRSAPRTHAILPGAFGPTSTLNKPGSTMHAPHNGHVSGIHGETTSVGADGIGSTMTISVRADGVSICSIAVPCASLGDFSATCAGEFDAGQDVHMEITASGCDVKPSFVGSANIEF